RSGGGGRREGCAVAAPKRQRPLTAGEERVQPNTEFGKGAAEHLTRGVSQQGLGGGGPDHDLASAIDGDDGIAERRQNLGCKTHRAGARGSRSVKRLPRPGTLMSSSRLPPWRAASCRLMYKPSSVPGTPAVDW